VRKSPIYATVSANINNFIPLFYIFSLIYIKNPFNLNFIPSNRSIKGILTFVVPITLIFISKTALLSYS